MPRFGIITPTIPERESFLLRCMHSVEEQRKCSDWQHYIVGDGSMPAVPSTTRRQVSCTPVKSGYWGNEVRNYAIQAYAGECEYFLFLDDDNILLPGALWRLSQLDADIIFTRFIKLDAREPHQFYPPGDIKSYGREVTLSLNYCVRSNIARRCKWLRTEYTADFTFVDDCRKIAKTEDWLDEPIAVWCTGEV